MHNVTLWEIQTRSLVLWIFSLTCFKGASPGPMKISPTTSAFSCFTSAPPCVIRGSNDVGAPMILVFRCKRLSRRSILHSPNDWLEALQAFIFYLFFLNLFSMCDLVNAFDLKSSDFWVNFTGFFSNSRSSHLISDEINAPRTRSGTFLIPLHFVSTARCPNLLHNWV